MGTKEYGRKELERVGYFKEGDDPYNDAVANGILELLEVFDNQGHSGFTAPYTAQMFHRLAMFKPITPLTGEDDEWNEVGTDVFQNKRYSAVFKDGKNGKAYNIEGKIFSDDGGETWFTNRNSIVYIDFPYTVPEHPEKIILKEEERQYERLCN